MHCLRSYVHSGADSLYSTLRERKTFQESNACLIFWKTTCKRESKGGKDFSLEDDRLLTTESIITDVGICLTSLREV